MGIFSRLFRSRDPSRLARELMKEARVGNYAAVESIIVDVMSIARVPEKLALGLVGNHNSHQALLGAVAAGGVVDNVPKEILSLGLFEAAAEGHLRIVKLLSDYGADLDRPHATDNSTAMGIAAFAGRDDVVQFLTWRAADVNAKNRHGLTPVMLAAGKCSAETVSKMIDAGADLHAKDNSGLTVKDFASMPPREDILELLQAAPESGVNLSGKEPGLTAPAVKGGVCKATYKKFGFVMKAFADVQSCGPIRYLYIFEVSSEKTGKPQFYVTAEISELVAEAEPVLSIFDETGHRNFGKRPAIGELHMFIATARLIAQKHITERLSSQ